MQLLSHALQILVTLRELCLDALLLGGESLRLDALLLGGLSLGFETLLLSSEPLRFDALLLRGEPLRLQAFRFETLFLVRESLGFVKQA